MYMSTEWSYVRVTVASAKQGKVIGGGKEVFLGMEKKHDQKTYEGRAEIGMRGVKEIVYGRGLIKGGRVYGEGNGGKGDREGGRGRGEGGAD